MNKIVLGTVQFGVNYGINNTSGQVTQEEVCNILKIAEEQGIRTLDTSSGYGASEMVLGKTIKETNTLFNIVSKYPRSEKSVRESFQTSIDNLGVETLYGYLIHHFDFYQENPEIFDEMTSLKDEGKIQKVGFSLYNVEQLQYLLDKKVRFNIIQFPYNIFDKQFEPYMAKLTEMGVEIHTRSAFLQGLFFKDPQTLPEKLKPLKNYLDSLHIYCAQHGITVEQLALGYVLANPYVKGALIGVDNHSQLEANLKVAWYQITKEDLEYVHNIEIKEERLLNPVNWN